MQGSASSVRLRSRLTQGFTIVELLVVIVVVGILASITVVAYGGIQDRARSAVASGDLRNLSTQMELYRTEHGVYPTSRPDLEPVIRGASLYEETRWSGDISTRADRGYLFCFDAPLGESYKIVAFEPMHTFLRSEASQHIGKELLYTETGGGIKTTEIAWSADLESVSANMCHSVGSVSAQDASPHQVWSYNVPSLYAP